MIRFKMMFGVVMLAAVGVVAAQPCGENHGCFENYFCDMSTYVCLPCRSCKDLKREELPSKEPCIQSIKDCGPCLDDLVDSKEDGVTCVPRSEGAGAAAAADNSTTPWIVAGVAIAIFVVVAAVVVIRYMFRKSSFFKLQLDTNIGATLPTHVVATAPESPPPYSPNHAPDLPRPGEDTELPLIKPYQPPFPAYESQDRQNVSVFNPPSYVRLNNRSDLPHPQEEHSDVNDNYSLPVHDEDTTPSPWAPGNNYTVTTPGPTVNGAANLPPQDGAAADFSSALAVARNTDLIQPPQVTLRMQTNGNEEPTNGDEPHAQYSTQSGTSRAQGNPQGNFNVMNVNQIITIIKPPLDKQRSF